MVQKPTNKSGQSIKLSLDNLLFLFKLQKYSRETWNDLFNKFRKTSERRLKKI